MILKISDFISDNKTDRESLQEMFDAVPTSVRNVVFDLEGRDFTIDGTLYWKKEADRITTIKGYGTTITAAPGVDVILTGDKGKGLSVAWDGSENNIIRWMDKIRIFGIRFNGGGTQLELVGTSQSKIEDCFFFNGNIGVKVIFGLQTNIEQCYFQFQAQENILLLTGAGDPITGEDKYFPNGRTFNSQSNRSVIRDCRFYNKLRSGKVPFACVRTMGNDGIHIDNCVFEGAPAEYPIYHDRQGSNTVVSFKVSNPHMEYPGYESYIKALIRAHGGVSIEIIGMYVQAAGCVNLDCDASGSGTVHIIRPLYVQVGNGGVKAGSNQSWKVYDPPVLDVWFKEDSWVGGKVPVSLFIEDGGNLIGYRQSWNLMNNFSKGRIGIQSLNSTRNRLFFGGHENESELMQNLQRILDFKNTSLVQPKDMADMEAVSLVPVLLMKEPGKTVYIPLVKSK